MSDTVITAPSVNAFRKQLNTVNLEVLNCWIITVSRVLVALWTFVARFMC